MQLEGTLIRIPCNQAARDSFVNALGGQPPTIPRAGSVRMPCAFFLDDPSDPEHLLTDLGNLVTAQCVIRAGDAAGAVLFEQTIPAASFNAGLTFAQWTAGTAAHCEFALTPADTNLPAGPLHIAIGVTTANGGDIPLAYCSTASLRDYGIFNAALLPADATGSVGYESNTLQIPLEGIIAGEMQFAFNRRAASLLIVVLSCAPLAGAADDVLAARRTANGVSVLDLRGVANATYLIQICDNLSAANWTDLITGTTDAQGLWQTTDYSASTAVRRFYRARLVAIPTVDLYADSISGNDAHNGLSVPDAFRTLAALRAAALTRGPGVRIGLVSGSSWRESLDLSNLSNIAIQAVGNGALPVIDGVDAVTAWTPYSQGPNAANVYQATVTHDALGSPGRLTVYEDGALLARVADVATCNTTPGSFVDAKASDGSPLTIFLHPAAAGSPATNGHLYEVTTRNLVLALGTGATVSGVQTMRAIDNNGSLDGVNIPGLTVSRCLAVDGTKHNLGVGSGTVTDCLCVRNDRETSYEPSDIPFIAFLNDGTGQSALFERCGVAGCVGNDFYAHGNPNSLAHFALRQTWTLGNLFAGPADRIEGSYYRTIALPTNHGVITRLLASLPTNGAVSYLGSEGPVSLSDCAVYTPGRQSAGNNSAIFNAQGASPIALTGNAFAGLSDQTNIMAYSSGAWTLTANRNVYFGGGTHLYLVNAGAYVGDRNVFYTGAANQGYGYLFSSQIGATGYPTLAAWQAATGQDEHSVYLLAADQTAGNAGAFWLAHKLAAAGTDLTTVGPAAGDFRINPAAKVYGADGAAHVGTFPDGTAITTAGPQTHGDWNARVSAPGVPTA